LKLKCDILLSTSGFRFNLRRYTQAGAAPLTVLVIDAAVVVGVDDGNGWEQGGAYVTAGRCRLIL